MEKKEISKYANRHSIFKSDLFACVSCRTRLQQLYRFDFYQIPFFFRGQGLLKKSRSVKKTLYKNNNMVTEIDMQT